MSRISAVISGAERIVRCLIPTDASLSLPRLWISVGLLCGAGLVAGCTSSSIADARHQLAIGNYAAAHEYFEVTRTQQLSARERREVMDGLCFTEHQIGTPTYPLASQLRTCAAALNEPESESGPIFADVARKERTSLTRAVSAALAQSDIAAAEDAILRYRSIPGSNPQLAAEWTRRVWTIVNRDAGIGRSSLTPTILQLARQFRREQSMNDQQFRRWIEQNMTIDGSLMVSSVEISKRTVNLWLEDQQLANAALNLDRFARVNNGLVARCRCDARTKVALRDSGLPAYLVRLDPASRQSEVLILDQPERLLSDNPAANIRANS